VRFIEERTGRSPAVIRGSPWNLNAGERLARQLEIHWRAPALGICSVEAPLQALVRSDVISDLGPLLRLFLSVLEMARDPRILVRGLGTLGGRHLRRGR
jgi:hypothetical protein